MNAPADFSKPQRIAKAMARLGICSRREAERLIQSGQVFLNNQRIESPALNVSDVDILRVSGKTYALAYQAPQMWIYYKPSGFVCTRQDPQGRPTIFEDLKKNFPKLPYVISIGRLDLNSEGLLLLTTCGKLSRHLELPQNKFVRTYRVRVRGRPKPNELEPLKEGLIVNGVRYGPIQAEVEHYQSTNTWLLFSLQEGKNREIRNILAHLGYTVNRLIRLSYGPFELKSLKPHQVEPVSQTKIVSTQALRQKP